jgi:glycosyltransferase involved in cell wall biosynthesis
MPRKIPVTVLIPAYNAQKFLPAAVDSVRSQTVDVDEIIVVDDGSSDDTADVAKRLGTHVVGGRRGGPAAARNAGLAVAKSEWIATLDADDVWHSRKLELQYDAVSAEPELGLVFTDFDAVSMVDGSMHKANVVGDDRSFMSLKHKLVTPVARRLDFSDFLTDLPRRPIVLPSSALFRRDLALAIGGFPTNVKAEDTEFFLRLASRTATGFLDLPLVAYMRHPSQITSNWELDPVRLSLYHHVMANKSQYHELVVAGFKKQYATLLYYSAANCASKRQLTTSAGLLAKAVAVALSRGEFGALSHAVAQSRLLRGRIRRSNPASVFSMQSPYDTIVRDLEIPWRCNRAA